MVAVQSLVMFLMFGGSSRGLDALLRNAAWWGWGGAWFVTRTVVRYRPLRDLGDRKAAEDAY